MIAAALTAWNFVRKMSPTHWAIAALIGVVIILMGTCTINNVQNHFDRNNAVKTNNADRELREDLSDRRQNTETRITTEERALNAALDQLPDDTPSARRLARACLELRNDGHIELPAACGSQAN